MANATVLAGPVQAIGDLEWTIHSCPATLRREFRDVFVELQAKTLEDMNELLVVEIFQATENPMTGFYDEQEDERERKAQRFVEWSRPIVEKIRARGFWADSIDPLLGQPVVGSRGGSVFVDSEIGLHLLGYNITDVGCCKILSHLRWGTKAYPSSLFSLAPLDVTLESLNAASG